MDFIVDLFKFVVFLGYNGISSLFKDINNPSVFISKGDLSNLNWVLLKLFFSIS